MVFVKAIAFFNPSEAKHRQEEADPSMDKSHKHPFPKNFEIKEGMLWPSPVKQRRVNGALTVYILKKM